jgi:hypothetical protein
MRALRAASTIGILALTSFPAGAQSPVALRVVDTKGSPVPFAVVSIANGSPIIADDSGRVRAKLKTADSVRVHARRIGFREFNAWARRGEDAVYRVVLADVAQAVDAVTVTERLQTPLALRGFYDRADRVRNGAIVGEFITPEEIEARNAMRVSQLLQGRRTVRVRQAHAGTVVGEVNRRSQSVLVGRGGCVMAIIVDGQVVQSSAQDMITEDVPTSVMSEGTKQNTGDGTARGSLPIFMDIDDLVNGSAVMGIEIYPSASTAPAELLSLAGRGSCGIVAIWTGNRR